MTVAGCAEAKHFSKGEELQPKFINAMERAGR